MEDEIRQRLAVGAVLWSVADITAGDVVMLACDALVDGLDSQALRELAGLPVDSSVYEVADLLSQVAEDFGFRFHTKDSFSGRTAAARVLAARCVAGGMTPRDLAHWMHERIGHNKDAALDAIVNLDDEYDTIEYTDRSAEEVDRAVVDAARHLLAT